MVKMYFSIILISLITGCQNPGFEKVSKASISQSRLEIAEQLTEKLMIAMSSGNHYQLSASEATPKVVQAFTEQLQKQSYNQVRSLFGDYKAHSFREVWKAKDGSESEIFRFKAQFESNSTMEIRTVLDKNGKLAGFFIRLWKDSL